MKGSGSVALVVALALAAGCAPSLSRDAREERFDPSLDDALRAQTEREAAPGRESRWRSVEPDPERWSVRTLPERDEPRETLLGTRRFVNVRFARADLEDALRFLAEAGGFGLIADGELSGSVDADLRHVRPYEALVAIAEAHHAKVERKGRLVVVSQH